MKRRMLRKLVSQLLIFTACALPFVAGCGQANPESATSVGSTPEAVTISWFDSGVTRSAEITLAQAEWLKSARLRAKERFFKGLPAVKELPPGVEAVDGTGVVQSALTTGSNLWSDCANYDWFLVSEKSDGMGRLWCAKFSTSGGFDTILIGGGAWFVPHWFDSAASVANIFNICTSGSNNCRLTQCCENGSCSGVWRSFFQNSGSGNISPPVDANSMSAQNGVLIC